MIFLPLMSCNVSCENPGKAIIQNKIARDNLCIQRITGFNYELRITKVKFYNELSAIGCEYSKYSRINSTKKRYLCRAFI